MCHLTVAFSTKSLKFSALCVLLTENNSVLLGVVRLQHIHFDVLCVVNALQGVKGEIECIVENVAIFLYAS